MHKKGFAQGGARNIWKALDSYVLLGVRVCSRVGGGWRGQAKAGGRGACPLGMEGRRKGDAPGAVIEGPGNPDDTTREPREERTLPRYPRGQGLRAGLLLRVQSYLPAPALPLRSPFPPDFTQSYTCSSLPRHSTFPFFQDVIQNYKCS